MSGLSDAVVARLRDLVERPEIPTTRYEILDRIGEGGMGVVYLARDRELGREVALKVLRTPEPSAEERDRILREARILASLEHPGIAPVHDVGVLADGRVFYVMKRVRGERLDSLAISARPRTELLRLFRQVCDAVAFAHAAGVIHRDLKPQNVMLGAFGEVLVLDWGVAKLRGHPVEATDASSVQPTGEDTAPGAVMGTPGYMAPEQLTGRSAEVDERADVFGLGGILCFLLTGNHPPAGFPEGERWLAVPTSLRAICERARAPVPELRYRSASELAADVANYLDALPVTAHREGLLERGRRVAARHRIALLLILAYLLMRVTLLVVTGR
jgi:eukaryotic-like serine/threonine-protein kinase